VQCIEFWKYVARWRASGSCDWGNHDDKKITYAREGNKGSGGEKRNG